MLSVSFGEVIHELERATRNMRGLIALLEKEREKDAQIKGLREQVAALTKERDDALQMSEQADIMIKELNEIQGVNTEAEGVLAEE